jgi:phosphatidate cytidylyltransferase
MMPRVLSGLVLAGVFLTIIWFSTTPVLLLVALVVCTLAFHEYVQLIRQLGAEMPRLPTLLATLAALAMVPFPHVQPAAVVALGLAIVAAAGMARFSGVFSAAVLGASAGALSIVYLGLPLGALVGVHLFGGREAVILLIATIVVSDTAQFYSGRLLGRRPLAPRLSPKKTIEGAVGGLVVAPLFLSIAAPYLLPGAPPLLVVALGVALVAAGIAGDLFESMLKRAADVKDSSALIPGHGGVLDRIDALLFASPLFYIFVRWMHTH